METKSKKSYSKSKGAVERRKRVIERLENQKLKSKSLTEGDKERIDKEIKTLRSRI